MFFRFKNCGSDDQLSVEMALERIEFCHIKDLTLSSSNFSIMGIVIAKSDVFNMTSNYDGRMKSVITLTIRDSRRFFINCKVWGSCEFIENCDRAYRVGDVITVMRPRAVECDRIKPFAPNTTSPFELTITENRGSFYRQSIEWCPKFAEFKNISVKSTSQVMRLNDIVSLPSNVSSKDVDVLVAVQSISATRTVNTRNGEKTVRDVIVMDQTAESIRMTLWCAETVQRADEWTPMETLLHLIDVLVTYSTFYKCWILSPSRRTIVFENPDQSLEVTILREYLSSLPNAKRNALVNTSIVDTEINSDDIVDVMTIQKVKDKATADDSAQKFGAKIFAVVTRLDLANSSVFGPFNRHCAVCDKRIFGKDAICQNDSCEVKTSFYEKYSIPFDLSDQTGTLRCRLNDEAAERLLNRPVIEFRRLNEDQIEMIRWKYLLERIEAKIVVSKNTNENEPKFWVKIIEVKLIDDPCRVANELVTY